MDANIDMDEGHLLTLLDQLTKDLAIPFLERRGRDHLHKRSAMGNLSAEELRDAVEQLNERERELLAAVGISKMLLEKGKHAVSAYQEAKEQQDLLERVVKAHKQEISILREELKAAEEKTEKISLMLVEAEEHAEQLSDESMHFREFLKLRNSQKYQKDPDHESLIADMKELYEEQQQALERIQHLDSKSHLEKENEKLRIALNSMEKELLEKNQDVTKLKKEICASRNKVKELEETLWDVGEQIKAKDEEEKFKELDLSMARKRIEKLSEELEFIRPNPSLPKSHIKHQSFLGAMGLDVDQESDQHSCDEENFSPEKELQGESLPQLSSTYWFGNKSVDLRKKLLIQTLVTSLTIPSERREMETRKDPGEEYFILVRNPADYSSSEAELPIHGQHLHCADQRVV